MKKYINLLIIIVFLCFIVFLGYNRLCDYYPQKYSEFVERYSAENNIEPVLVYSLIKAESDFKPSVVSRANAYGLMQITEDTFKWIMTKTPGKEKYTKADLFDPEINIKYGTIILKYMLDEFENTDTALAAYNSGMGQVKSWLKDSNYSKDGKTLVYIPFRETNNYVKKINQYQKFYNFLY